MLPCNLVVYEDEQGVTTVAAIDPMVTMQMIKNPDLIKIAGQVQSKTKKGQSNRYKTPVEKKITYLYTSFIVNLTLSS